MAITCSVTDASDNPISNIYVEIVSKDRLHVLDGLTDTRGSITGWCTKGHLTPAQVPSIATTWRFRFYVEDHFKKGNALFDHVFGELKAKANVDYEITLILESTSHGLFYAGTSVSEHEDHNASLYLTTQIEDKDVHGHTPAVPMPAGQPTRHPDLLMPVPRRDEHASEEEIDILALLDESISRTTPGGVKRKYSAMVEQEERAETKPRRSQRLMSRR